MKKIVLLVAALLACVTATASAQGRGSVEDRLSRVESQVDELACRMERVERVVSGLATVSSNLVRHQAMMGEQPEGRMPVRYASYQQDEDDDEGIYLVADRAEPPAQAGTLAQTETGRVEFRAYGNGAVRLPLIGGGVIAVGPDPGRSWGGGSASPATPASYARERIEPAVDRRLCRPAYVPVRRAPMR